MRILKEDTIALVIDVQERLFPHIRKNTQLAANISTLVQGLKALDVPLIVTEQYKKGLGPTLPVIMDHCSDAPVFEKLAFSCADDVNIDAAISESGAENVILMGMESHICLLQTAIDLKAKGFNPIVIEDAVSSRTKANKKMAMKRFDQEGIIISSCESILFELCRVAGSDAFKTISKLVK